jgi:hypothetical protein
MGNVSVSKIQKVNKQYIKLGTKIEGNKINPEIIAD